MSWQMNECDNYNLDIVALLSELHWPGQRKTRHDKWEIICSGPDSNKREHKSLYSHFAANSLFS